MKQKALSGRLKKSNEALRGAIKQVEEQESRMETEEKVPAGYSGEEAYKAFLQTSICMEVRDRVNRLYDDKSKSVKTNMNVRAFQEFALSPQQLAMLAKAVKTHFPKLLVALKAFSPAMSRKDWLYCSLYLMEIDNMNLCILLQEPYPSYRRNMLKLEEALHCPQGLYVFLMEQIHAV
ncbi:MAG: hypothetical protein ACTTKO_02900 [Candidatus Limimorpha sp.]